MRIVVGIVLSIVMSIVVSILTVAAHLWGFTVYIRQQYVFLV